MIIAGKITEFYKRSEQKTYLHCGTHPYLYRHLGRIIPWPMIAIKPIELDVSQKSQLKRDFDRADLIILTSPSAVAHFIPIILSLCSPAELHTKVIAAIGKHTAKDLESFKAQACIISSEETAQGLFKTLDAIMSLSGKNILFPRSSLPNPFLKESLEKKGAIVHEWAVYLNTKPLKRDLPNEDIRGIIFTSPSTVQNFLEDYQIIPKHWEILAKGPVTEAVLKQAGYYSRIIL